MSLRVELDVGERRAADALDLFDSIEGERKPRDKESGAACRLILKGGRRRVARDPEGAVGRNRHARIVVEPCAAEESRVLNLAGGVEHGQHDVGAPLDSESALKRIARAVRAAGAIEGVRGDGILRERR